MSINDLSSGYLENLPPIPQASFFNINKQTLQYRNITALFQQTINDLNTLSDPEKLKNIRAKLDQYRVLTQQHKAHLFYRIFFSDYKQAKDEFKEVHQNYVNIIQVLQKEFDAEKDFNAMTQKYQDSQNQGPDCVIKIGTYHLKMHRSKLADIAILEEFLDDDANLLFSSDDSTANQPKSDPSLRLIELNLPEDIQFLHIVEIFKSLYTKEIAKIPLNEMVPFIKANLYFGQDLSLNLILSGLNQKLTEVSNKIKKWPPSHRSSALKLIDKMDWEGLRQLVTKEKKIKNKKNYLQLMEILDRDIPYHILMDQLEKNMNENISENGFFKFSEQGYSSYVDIDKELSSLLRILPDEIRLNFLLSEFYDQHRSSHLIDKTRFECAFASLAIAEYRISLLHSQSHFNIDKNKASEESLLWLQRASNRNLPKAQYDLAIKLINDSAIDEILLKNKNINLRRKDAIDYLHKAAFNGLTEANICLAECYEKGLFVEKNLIQAFEHYEKATKKGNLQACLTLAKYHELGIETPIDLTKAFNYYKQAAQDLNDLTSLIKIARMYELGQGVNTDLQKAFELYQQAANRGSTSSQVKIGEMYEYGQGVSKDIHKAIDWYLQAYQNQDTQPLAALKLAHFYEEGFILERSFKEAYKCYADASKDYAEASLKVGEALLFGRGVTQNLTKSFSFFEKATQQGNLLGKYWMAKMLFEGKGVDKDRQRARILFRELAEGANSPAGLYGRGMCYQFDTDASEENLKIAFNFYQKAAEAGFSEAALTLAQAYHKGFSEAGIKQDLNQAFKWYEKAAEQNNSQALYQLVLFLKPYEKDDIDKVHLMLVQAYLADPSALLIKKELEKIYKKWGSSRDWEKLSYYQNLARGL